MCSLCGRFDAFGEVAFAAAPAAASAALVRDSTALTGSFGWGWWYVQGVTGYTAKPLVLTYSFPASAPQSQALVLGQGSAATFQPFNENEKALARGALQQWADASGLQFIEVAGERGDLRFSWFDFSTTPAYDNFGGIGFAPYGAFSVSGGRVFAVSEEYWFRQNVLYDHGGDTFYNSDYRSRVSDAKSFTHLLLHEIGHALGLKHPHEGDPLLAKDQDTGTNTVMSYSLDRSDRLGPLDVAAIQALYGPASADGSQFISFAFDAARQQTSFVYAAGADLIRGTSTHDIIDAGPGNDAVFASYGNDRIIGGAGLDNISGGVGTDTYVTGLPWTGRTALSYVAGGATTLRVAEGTEFIYDVERFAFGEVVLAFDVDGTAGQSYRLYQAAFARTPDVQGLSWWTRQMDDGMPLVEAARQFLVTPEAQAAYGSAPSATQFVGKLYQNVLGRAGEPSGVNFWVGQIETNARDRAQVLSEFAQSPENVALVGSSVRSGIELMGSVVFA
jgi:hypothetical protein